MSFNIVSRKNELESHDLIEEGSSPSKKSVISDRLAAGITTSAATSAFTIVLVTLLLVSVYSPVDGLVSTSPVTLHVLDTSTGYPGAGVFVELQMNSTSTSSENCGWIPIASTTTDSDGRGPDLFPDTTTVLETGIYKMIFHTGDYFAKKNIDTFYPKVEVMFNLSNSSFHYHIPLLISPFGYTTYRGS